MSFQPKKAYLTSHEKFESTNGNNIDATQEKMKPLFLSNLKLVWRFDKKNNRIRCYEQKGNKKEEKPTREYDIEQLMIKGYKYPWTIHIVHDDIQFYGERKINEAIMRKWHPIAKKIKFAPRLSLSKCHVHYGATENTKWIVQAAKSFSKVHTLYLPRSVACKNQLDNYSKWLDHSARLKNLTYSSDSGNIKIYFSLLFQKSCRKLCRKIRKSRLKSLQIADKNTDRESWRAYAEMEIYRPTLNRFNIAITINAFDICFYDYSYKEFDPKSSKYKRLSLSGCSMNIDWLVETQQSCKVKSFISFFKDKYKELDFFLDFLFEAIESIKLMEEECEIPELDLQTFKRTMLNFLDSEKIRYKEEISPPELLYILFEKDRFWGVRGEILNQIKKRKNNKTDLPPFIESLLLYGINRYGNVSGLKSVVSELLNKEINQSILFNCLDYSSFKGISELNIKSDQQNDKLFRMLATQISEIQTLEIFNLTIVDLSISDALDLSSKLLELPCLLKAKVLVKYTQEFQHNSPQFDILNSILKKLQRESNFKFSFEFGPRNSYLSLLHERVLKKP